jgi:thymidylate kinase
MMDSPRLIEKPGNKGLTAFLYNWLARVERNIYRQILPPNIVLRLRVSLENAKKRNAAREIVDDETYLETRHEQVENWFVTGARHISDIDTNHSLETTIARVKQVIWSNL